MHSKIILSDIDNKLLLQRLTALWALSESALGGLLHAFKLPFTGLIVSSAAVLIISGMARYGIKRGEILKATLIVILAKVVVSPHSPVNAHFAVLMQGLIGEILFYSRRNLNLITIFFAAITAVLSALQKIVVLTLLFGFNLWSAIDAFFTYVLNELSIDVSLQSDLTYSKWIISSYLFIHLIIGFVVGFFSLSIFNNISERYLIQKDFDPADEQIIAKNTFKRKKKFWWMKTTGIILLVILFATAVYSYFNEPENSVSLSIAVIVLRSFGITIVWYYLIAPYANKFLSNYFGRQKSKHSAEINEILNLIPIFKKIISESYASTSNIKGLRRYKMFLIVAFSNIIFYKLK